MSGDNGNGAGGPPAAEAYSLAFEKLVNGPDDIIGLIAYAKFKESVRESVCAGIPSSRATRVPALAAIKVYRSAAEQMITQVVNDGIAAATPDMQQTAITTKIDSSHRELLAKLSEHRAGTELHVTKQTSFKSAFFAGVVSWAASLMLVVVIYLMIGKPSAEEMIAGRVSHSTVNLQNPDGKVGK